ncbi:glycosyltransferase family 4 protein [Halobellus sp. GCM10025813]
MLTGGHEGDAVGGAQLQQILIGKELAKRGYEVIFVEYAAEYKKEQRIDGIKIVTKPRPKGSELSRAAKAVVGTLRTLRRIDPDVCYRRVLDFEILPLSFYCSLTDTRFVYGFAHDNELTDDSTFFSKGVKQTSLYRRLNQFAISTADSAIAQNAYQYNIATSRYDTDVYQIPNCYQIEEVEPIDWDYESPVIFWAARIERVKRPKTVVKLARKLPDVTFVMAGGPGNAELYSELQQEAESLENLVLLGHIPFEEIDRHFAAADLFLNTSEAEGFPNTFLQAWANETPVASLAVDPNEILSSQGIGLFADGSVETLCEEMRDVIDDEELLSTLGQDSREYLHENHSVEAISEQYERVLLGEGNGLTDS